MSKRQLQRQEEDEKNGNAPLPVNIEKMVKNTTFLFLLRKIGRTVKNRYSIINAHSFAAFF